MHDLATKCARSRLGWRWRDIRVDHVRATPDGRATEALQGVRRLADDVTIVGRGRAIDNHDHVVCVGG